MQGRRRRKSGRLRSARSVDEWMGGCVGGGEVAGRVGSVGVPHQVCQAPCEMSWKVLLVAQARARDSIERIGRWAAGHYHSL